MIFLSQPSNLINIWEDEILPNLLKNYNYMIDAGVPREQARGFLPQNMMTTFTMTMDLHNLFHFLALRTSEHAQQETREVAVMLLEKLKLEVPKLVDMWIIKTEMDRAYRDQFYEEFKKQVHGKYYKWK